MKWKKRNIMIYLLIVSFLFNTLNLHAGVKDTDICYVGEIISEADYRDEVLGEEDNPLENNKIKVETRNIVEIDNVTVSYYLKGIWENGYSLEIKMDNNGENPIRNWKALIPIDGEAVSCWGGDIIASTKESIVVSHTTWNAKIEPGESVSFGMNVNGTFTALPSSFSFVEGTSVFTDEISYSLAIKQEWDGGFNALLTVTNNGVAIDSDWQMEFDYENDISNFWGGNIVSHSGMHYIICPYWSGCSFGMGEEMSFGFQVLSGEKECKINNIVISNGYNEIDPENGGDNYEENTYVNDDFIKDFSECDIVFNEENEERYIRNQVVVGFMPGVDKSVIEEIIAQLDARIVGYISIAEMYQIEFNEEKEYDQLYEIIYELESYSFVNYAILNHVSFVDDMYYPSEGYTDDWNMKHPDGQNWGLEAMYVPNAWDRRGEFTGKVKVGIIDSDFDNAHPDLKFKEIEGDYANSDKKNHGTHVAGIIGATFGNQKGITGVATNVDLYGYTKKGNVTSFTSDADRIISLIKKNVKIINISQGYGYEVLYEVYINKSSTKKNIEKDAKAMSDSLKELLLSGYDFLIVNAAGNASDKYFIKKGSSYIQTEEADNTEYLMHSNAEYAYFPNAIKDKLVKEHILVVGAVNHTLVNKKEKYYIANYSGRGDRVDVYAPGTDIYSTINSTNNENPYGYMNGTSMATPHITGLAALIWQANPSLTSLQVKNIILESKGHVVEEPGENKESEDDDKETGYYIPDAGKCIDTALGFTTSDSESNLPKGTITGKVTDIGGKALFDMTVLLVRTSVGQANLSEYYYTKVTNLAGEYKTEVVAGTYELIVYDPNCKYLPVKVSNLVVSSEETKNIETIKISATPLNISQLKNASIQGKVCNALNGNDIWGAEVHIRTGWNNCEGKYIESKKATTGISGCFNIAVACGNYTVEIRKNGFIVGYFNVVSAKKTSDIYETMVLTPVLDDNEYRIILTWDEDPEDLDSHLTYYDSSGMQKMHVFFGDPTGYASGKKVAQLDIDDTSGYGPETITMTLNAEDLKEGEKFIYSVHKYSGRKSLAASDAEVRVYLGNSLIDTFSVPTYFNDSKNVWQVFMITKGGLRKLNGGRIVSGVTEIE